MGEVTTIGLDIAKSVFHRWKAVLQPSELFALGGGGSIPHSANAAIKASCQSATTANWCHSLAMASPWRICS